MKEFGVIIVLMGILQFILLIKIWIMTNDVKKIKKRLPPKDLFVKQGKILSLQGQKEDAEKSYKKAFFSELYEIATNEEVTRQRYERAYKKLIERYEYRIISIDFEKYNTLEKFRSF